MRPGRYARNCARTDKIGWILLAFAVFNTYMLLCSTAVNRAVFGCS
jgi:succinate-acetate transporter protein